MLPDWHSVPSRRYEASATNALPGRLAENDVRAIRLDFDGQTKCVYREPDITIPRNTEEICDKRIDHLGGFNHLNIRIEGRLVFFGEGRAPP